MASGVVNSTLIYGNTLSNLNASNLAFGNIGGSLIYGNTLSNINASNISQPFANLVVSNSVTTTNVSATQFVGAGGFAIATGGPTVGVTGNVYVSNAVQTTNVVTATITYTQEDLTKRAPHLLPSLANASTIQAWISATCNASSQPTKSWWATSPVPTFNSNLASTGSNQHSGGVLLPDGRVLFVPNNATTSIGFFNPATNQYSSIAPTGDSIQQYFGGILLPNANVAFVPYNSTLGIGIYNPLTNVLKHFGAGIDSRLGGVLEPSGNIAIMPGAAVYPNVITYSPILNSYTNIVLKTDGSVTSSVLLPNGNIIGVPGTNANILQYQPSTLTVSNIYNVGSTILTKFSGGVLAPDGNVIMLPARSSNSNIGVYNPSTVTFSNIVTNTTQGVTASFRGGCLLPSGNIIGSPYASANLIMIDPSALTYSNFAPFSAITGTYSGCVLTPSGRVVFVPYYSANVGVLNTMVPVDPTFCLSPYFNKY